MGKGCGKMIIHGDDVARLNESTANDILGTPSLVCREEVFFPKHVLYCFLQFVKTLRSGIGIVGLHHRGKLVVAHGIGSAVCEHVQENISGGQLKCVETRILNGKQTPVQGYQV